MDKKECDSKKISNINESSFVGVILAAGVGSRLRPITNSLPKALVKTAGKSIIQYQLEAYQNAGIKNIIIVVGYQAEKIREYFKHIKELNIEIIENKDYENSNNMYSFYLASKYIGDRPFILNNADVALDPKIIAMMLSSKEENAIAVDSSVFNEESMKITVNEMGYIDDISKTITKDLAFGCSIDFYKFSREDGKIFINQVNQIIEKEGNLKDWTEVALKRALGNQTLKFRPIDIAGLSWVEIDNYEDLAVADYKFSNFNEKLSSINTIFFDLDGTVYLGDKVIPGSVETINYLRNNGKRVYFLSNNSSKNISDYVRKLCNIGICAKPEDVILSTNGVIKYLKENSVKRIWVWGTVSLTKTFIDNGFVIDKENPEYVVIGYDTEIDYRKLIDVCSLINRNIDIIATHGDIYCPSEFGPIPDVGAILEMIRLTTGKAPTKIFGKPYKEMLNPVLEGMGIESSSVLIVGDRLHTDIKMAQEIGAYGLLVLSGATNRDELQDSDIQPDFILNSISSMVPILKSELA